MSGARAVERNEPTMGNAEHLKAPGHALDRLRERLDQIYRNAYPDIAPELVSAWVSRAFMEAKEAHRDFDDFGAELWLMAGYFYTDYAIAKPVEYLEALYTLAVHADFAEAARARVFAAQAEKANPGLCRVQ